MRFAVVGAGFAGLAAATYLAEQGHQVELYEKTERVGGLATGFGKKTWKYPLEIFYHHIFTNDSDIIEFSEKVGWPAFFKVPTTSSLIGGNIYQLDSPVSVLKFAPLSLIARIQMGIGLGILKVIPNGKFLEKYLVYKVLPKLVGNEAYKAVWEKLLKAKFGKYINEVNMAWFWSRIAKRTQALGYFNYGFEGLAKKTLEYYKEKGGSFFGSSEFDFDRKNVAKYDRVIVTVPAPIANKVTKVKAVPEINYLSAQTLILELNKSLMSNYWLNVLEKEWPFLVVVEHTRFVDKKNYGGKYIVYLGNYLEPDHPQLKKTKEELLSLYLPFLKKINKEFNKSWIADSFVFRANFAQPVFPVNYSRKLANINKKEEKIWYANMSMVYPFDRGTNYAVKLGIDVAKTAVKQK